MRLGAKIRAEMSWLLAAGEGSFFADGCYLGGRRSYGGRFELAGVRVGRRSFVGNSAILPPGAGLGDNCLLGVLSVPPSSRDPTPDGTDWLGSPAFRLPNRQKVGGFDERTTFRPRASFSAARASMRAAS
jgi:non-ribosomal peptide synthetase-like protein